MESKIKPLAQVLYEAYSEFWNEAMNVSLDLLVPWERMGDLHQRSWKAVADKVVALAYKILEEAQQDETT